VLILKNDINFGVRCRPRDQPNFFLVGEGADTGAIYNL